MTPSLESRAEAAAWIARLHGPQRSEEVEEGFRRWLAERPENASTFEGMTEIWDAVGHTSAGRFPRVNVRHALKPRRAWIAAAAAIVTSCGVAIFLAGRFPGDPVYSTGVGQQKTIQLDDGSRVALNSDTHLTVRYDKAVRHIALDRGEAFFEVAKDPRRPFAVIAGDRKITAVGTSFAVRNDTGRIAVTLVEGKVSITPLAQTAQAPVLLSPGERFTIAAQRTEQLDKPVVDAVTAWRRGEIVLDRTPLADAVVEINRYDSTAVLIDDPAIAAVQVSGNYKTGDARGFARAVAAMYGLEFIEREGRIHLRASAP